MSRHRGAKPDRRYGLLDPIHMIPNFRWVQTISSPCQRQGPDVLPWSSIEFSGSENSGPKSCRAKPLYVGNRRNAFRRGTVVTDRAGAQPTVLPSLSGDVRRRAPIRACVFQQRGVGFHR
jgi:hypothetical protein